MIINTHKLCKKGTLHWCFLYHFCPNDRVAAYHEKCSLEFKIPPQSFWISQISWCSFATLLGTLSLAHFVHCCPDQQARPAEGLPSRLSLIFVLTTRCFSHRSSPAAAKSPASWPSCRPATRPASWPSCRPATRPASWPSCRPATRSSRSPNWPGWRSNNLVLKVQIEEAGLSHKSRGGVNIKVMGNEQDFRSGSSARAVVSLSNFVSWNCFFFSPFFHVS